MDKKVICGALLTIIGLVFSDLCLLNAVVNPCSYNGMEGLLGSLLGTNTLVFFIFSLIVMILGLVICFWRAFGKRK